MKNTNVKIRIAQQPPVSNRQEENATNVNNFFNSMFSNRQSGPALTVKIQ